MKHIMNFLAAIAPFVALALIWFFFGAFPFEDLP